MTTKECKSLAAKQFAERKKLVRECIKSNQNLDTLPLLNWAMNQLFRAAREIELLKISADYDTESLPGIGCDATAEVILKRLVKTKKGWDLVYKTNPKLLKGYRKP